MLKLVTRAGHQERECPRQYRGGQFEGKPSFAAYGGSQHGASAAVRVEVVVLNPRAKRRCARGVDSECKPGAFVPDEHCLVNLDAKEPLPVAGADAVRRRRIETAGVGKAGKELAPVGRSWAKAAKTSLGGRSTLMEVSRRRGALSR